MTNQSLSNVMPINPNQISFLAQPEFDTKHGRAFREFHKNNPDVYLALIRMLKQAKYRGRTRIGMKMLFEVLRWNHTISTSDEDFKLNNNYTAYYTRLIKHTRPELGSILTTRASMADDEDMARQGEGEKSRAG